jgi:hypothetical protein
LFENLSEPSKHLCEERKAVTADRPFTNQMPNPAELAPAPLNPYIFRDALNPNIPIPNPSQSGTCCVSGLSHFFVATIPVGIVF